MVICDSDSLFCKVGTSFLGRVIDPINVIRTGIYSSEYERPLEDGSTQTCLAYHWAEANKVGFILNKYTVEQVTEKTTISKCVSDEWEPIFDSLRVKHLGEGAEVTRTPIGRSDSKTGRKKYTFKDDEAIGELRRIEEELKQVFTFSSDWLFLDRGDNRSGTYHHKRFITKDDARKRRAARKSAKASIVPEKNDGKPGMILS